MEGMQMDDRFKQIIYILGIIAAIYLIIGYVLPFIFTVLGIAFGILFIVFKWALIIVGLILLVGFILKLVKK